MNNVRTRNRTHIDEHLSIKTGIAADAGVVDGVVKVNDLGAGVGGPQARNFQNRLVQRGRSAGRQTQTIADTLIDRRDDMRAGRGKGLENGHRIRIAREGCARDALQQDAVVIEIHRATRAAAVIGLVRRDGGDEGDHIADQRRIHIHRQGRRSRIDQLVESGGITGLVIGVAGIGRRDGITAAKRVAVGEFGDAVDDIIGGERAGIVAEHHRAARVAGGHRADAIRLDGGRENNRLVVRGRIQ